MIKLTGNNVLVRRMKPAAVSQGGIHLDMTRQDDQKQFLVLAVGPGKTVRKKGKPSLLVPAEVAAGDFVLASLYTGNKMDLGNGDLIIDADEIVAKWGP